jgi:hypothetical protein
MSTRYDNTPRTLGGGFLFGIPLNDLGWFASLLMGLASGMAAFFAATFCGIVFVLFYNTGGHHTGAAALDYSDSYRRLGMPVGAIVGIIALSYLGMLWMKRKAGRT